MKACWSSLLPVFVALCAFVFGSNSTPDPLPMSYDSEGGGPPAAATLPAALAERSRYPALSAGAPGAWDQQYVYKPWVIKRGSCYEMWYVADSAAGLAPNELSLRGSHIGVAYSAYGLTFYRYHGNPVVRARGMGSPCVLYGDWRDGRGLYYKMWYRYSSDSPSRRGLLTQLAYATSRDGIHWADFGVIAGGSASDASTWGYRITSPCVLYLPDAPGLPAPYLMYYYAEELDVRLAVSQDGLHWQPRGAVLERGQPGDWDTGTVEDGSVFYLDGRLHMIYAGAGRVAIPDRGEWYCHALGYAVSDDGVHWYRRDRIVLAGSSDPQADDFSLTQPMWLVDGDRVRIYYSAFPSGASFHHIGCATMPVSQLLRGPLPTEKAKE
jgi:hypothetical protein